MEVFVSHHVFHTDADFSIAVKRPIEAHNVGGVAFMQHLQLSDNLIPDGRLDFQMDQLKKEMIISTAVLTKKHATDAYTSLHLEVKVTCNRGGGSPFLYACASF